MSTHKAEFYVKLKAVYTPYYSAAYQKIESVKAVGLFQNKPSCESNEKVVKVELDVPDDFFKAPVVVVQMAVQPDGSMKPITGEATPA